MKVRKISRSVNFIALFILVAKLISCTSAPVDLTKDIKSLKKVFDVAFSYYSEKTPSSFSSLEKYFKHILKSTNNERKDIFSILEFHDGKVFISNNEIKIKPAGGSIDEFDSTMRYKIWFKGHKEKAFFDYVDW